MRMRLESTLQPAALKAKLERDGWRVDQAADGSMLATNAEIVDQPNARLHLHQMGLLTSSKVHIEFLVSPSSSKPAQSADSGAKR